MKLKIIVSLAMLWALTLSSCKEQLDVKNPNQPTDGTLATEKGIVKIALAGVYVNGFVDLKYQDGVLGLFWGSGFHDIMADNLGAEAANVFMNQIGAAETVRLDDGTIIPNPNSPQHQPAMLRQNNQNGNLGQNPGYQEWAYMYSLNRVCNFILANVDKIVFTGDAATKKNVLKAWSYWWKAFAYSKIGSLYYAGLIVDDPNFTNGNYKTSNEILVEAEANFAKAEAILTTLSANAAYSEVLGKIIPDYFQVGMGGVLTPQMWVRNINTMRARNLVANKRVNTMTTADWNQVLTYTNSGINQSDLVFTGRSNDRGDIITSQGTVAAKATGDPASAATYKISERLIQQFQSGDKRLTNNFSQLPTAWIGNTDRGNIFNTRWQLLDGGAGLAGTVTYSNQADGATELYMAGTYEENSLLKAEANIYLGGAGVEAGLSIIDNVRNFQGAGLAALAGTGKTQAQAIQQLRSERRVALLFRSVAFYDARRYGIIDPVSSGGGLIGAVVVSKSGNNPPVVNTNAVIDYQFLDYWDVPDNELTYNKPAPGSAEVKNPKQ